LFVDKASTLPSSIISAKAARAYARLRVILLSGLAITAAAPLCADANKAASDLRGAQAATNREQGL
jgi:hypothetical protein